MAVGAVDFSKVLELNSYACKKAFSRLFMTGSGRYAYADDWNVLADCIENMFNTIDDMYRRWGDLAMFNPGVVFIQKMFQQVRRLFMETFECRRVFLDYRRLSWGDIATPEHTNVLIDVAKCLDDAMGRSPRRGRVVLVDPDDWGMAMNFIEDGTIVFANFGTKAMSPAEVQYYLDNYNVVFAVLIDWRRLGDTGAFYKVFYTEPFVASRIRVTTSFRVRRGAFFDSFGVYGCSGPHESLPADWDYMVSAMFKVPTAVRWTWQYGLQTEYERIHLGGLDIPPSTCVTIHISGLDVSQEQCNASAVLDPKFKEQLEIEFENRPSIGADILYSWAYARIGRGAVIELPLSGVIYSVDLLDWYIGAIAHVLLGERDKCYIGPTPSKLRNIVWMAQPGTGLTGWGTVPVPVSAFETFREWASRSKWRLVDMRSKKS